VDIGSLRMSGVTRIHKLDIGGIRGSGRKPGGGGSGKKKGKVLLQALHPLNQALKPRKNKGDGKRWEKQK